MPFLLVSRHAVEVRPYARSELCFLARQHFRACPTPAPAITKGLIRMRFRDSAIRLGEAKTVRVSSSPLVSVTACRRHYSGFPTGANSHCFPVGIGLRLNRRGSACRSLSRLYPSDPTLPVMRVGLRLTKLQRSLHVTACGFGRCHRLGPTVLAHSSSGLPCRGKFRLDVTTATRPLPIQLNGKLLNQTPFILEENKFINLSHG